MSRRRPPQVGEIVKYFPHGNPSEPWWQMEVKMVSPVNAVVLVGTRLTSTLAAEVVVKHWVHHVDSSHWERPGLPEGARRREGAWDYHDVWARLFDAHYGGEMAREQMRRQREAGKADMDPKLFNALELLEQYGSAEVSRIAQEVGLSVKELEKQEEFKTALREKKQAEYRQREGLKLKE